MKIGNKNYFTGEYRNIHLYYLMSMAINCWFITSNWLYFWTRYMTYGQLGWIDAIGFGFALLLEIPSGAVADLIGKKRTLQIAFLGGGIGTMLIATTTSLPQIFIGWLIAQIAYSFYSGAAEALAYDSMVDMRKEGEYDKVVTKGESLAMYVGAFTAFLGGYFYELHYRLPQFLWSASFFIGLLASLFVIEPRTDTVTFSFPVYLKQLRDGVKELFNPAIRRYSVFFFILSGIYFMYSWGLIRPVMATGFGFFSKEQAIIFPILTVLGAFIVRAIPWMRKRVNDYLGLMILSFVMALSFIAAALPLGQSGLMILFMIAMVGKFASPWLSIVINKHIPTRYRATTLSTASLINRLPYVLVGVTAGKMVEVGKLATFTVGIGVIILLGMVISLGFMFASGRVAKYRTVQTVITK